MEVGHGGINRFTFQYGSIQIANISEEEIKNLNLHSNMVLFK